MGLLIVDDGWCWRSVTDESQTQMIIRLNRHAKGGGISATNHSQLCNGRPADHQAPLAAPVLVPLVGREYGMTLGP